MNTQWQVKSLSRKCGVSGEIFQTGATVICYIFHKEGELVRTDILEQEVTKFEIPKNLVAKWTRTVSDETKETSQTGLLSNAEEIFLSLYRLDEEIQEDMMDKQEVLKHLLGLMLEKKRMLRRLKLKDKGIIAYLHIASKKEYRVREITLDLEEILKIQGQLDALVE